MSHPGRRIPQIGVIDGCHRPPFWLQELIAEEAANRKDIEDVIEEERSRVDAKTPITQAVFQSWREAQRQEKRKAAQDNEAERKRKGIITGREIFAQVHRPPTSLCNVFIPLTKGSFW